ncbi:MAG: AIPR family protein [Bacteroidota bacterium]
MVSEPEEIEDLVNTNGYLDVTLVFCQAERSEGFSTAKIGQIGYGITDFLSDRPTLPQNENIKHRVLIINEIFSRSSKFKKGNPQCYIYYCTSGRWTGDQALSARRDAVKNDILELSLFRKVEFECIDAERIQSFFRESKNAISTEVNFPQRTVLPELPGIEQAFIGFLSSLEYLKLIENSNEEIITSIFYDNVRHWQEWNPVNSEIKSTIENDDQKIYFPLLNNGVTIIAKRIIPTGNRFVLEDYQIVNGCQTSFVLHETRDKLNERILIPIRLVSTENAEIKNSIIKATNRQTEVPEEQLFALSDFPKKLEAYFPTFDGPKKLYYERRSRQYSSDSAVEKIRVINMTMLVRAYASFFLGYPHRTTRNYKALLKSIGSDIFGKDHCLEMYYVSAYASFKLEQLFRNGFLDASLKPARYHFLYLLRLLIYRDNLPRPNSNDMKRLCEDFMSILWNEDHTRELFSRASEIIFVASDGNLHRDFIRTEPFTDSIMGLL